MTSPGQLSHEAWWRQIASTTSPEKLIAMVVQVRRRDCSDTRSAILSGCQIKCQITKQILDVNSLIPTDRTTILRSRRLHFEAHLGEIPSGLLRWVCVKFRKIKDCEKPRFSLGRRLVSRGLSSSLLLYTLSGGRYHSKNGLENTGQLLGVGMYDKKLKRGKDGLYTRYIGGV